MTNISQEFYKKIAIESIGHCKDDYFIIGNLLRFLQSRKKLCEHAIQNRELFESDENEKTLIKNYDWYNEQILTILDIKL